MLTEYEFPPISRGLVIPDTSAESPPGSLSIATDVDITSSGAVRDRPGYQLAEEVHTTAQFAFPYRTTDSQYVVLESDGTGKAYTEAGTHLNDSLSFTGGPTGATGAAQMQRNITTYAGVDNVYVASPTNLLHRWDGAAFTSVAGTPKCRYLTQSGSEERMFAAGFTAGTNGPGSADTNGSRIWASDPGLPESWPSDVWLDFSPGDGEDINGLCTFNDQVFGFKKSKFVVINGETDVGGTVELLWREVTGAGLAIPGAYCVTPVGLFFLGKDGVYLTTGSTAVKVSGDIDGLFSGLLPSWCVYDRFLPPPDTPHQKMAFGGDSLYVSLSNASAGGAYSPVIARYQVYKQQWTLYFIDNIALSSMPWSDLSEDVVIGLARTSGGYRSFALHPALRTDTAAVIESEWQTHWFQAPRDEASVGIGVDNAMLMRLEAWGLGQISAGVVTDFGTSPNGTKTLVFDDLDPDADVWGNGTDALDVWGDGTDATDVWQGTRDVWSSDAADVWSSAATDVWESAIVRDSDLLRLRQPTQVFARNFNGRGRFLAIRFSKLTTSQFAYMERPRAIIAGR